MRSRFLPVSAAALLGACDAPDPTANETIAEVSAVAPPSGKGTEAAPAPRPGPKPATSDAIPERFHGIYDENVEACSRPSQYRLTVSASELRFHESIGTVRNVAVEAPDAIRITADYQGEGESWQSVRELRLADGAARLIMTGDGTSLTRHRCPAPGQ